MTCFSTSFCCSQSSVVDDCSHTCNSQRLYRCVLAISNICFVILALVCAAFLVSGTSAPIVILGLVISLVLCGVLLVVNVYYSRCLHAVVSQIVGGEIDAGGVGGSNQEMMTGLNSETTFTLDSDVIGNVLEEEVPVVLDRVEDKSLVSVAEATSDFHIARQESRDEESTSILDTAFQLSYSSTDAPSITEATGAADCDLGLLLDPASTVDKALIPTSFHCAIGRHYPAMIRQLCVQENLTIQEFRLLIDGLNQGNSIDSYPNHLRIKLQNFAFPNLQST